MPINNKKYHANLIFISVSVPGSGRKKLDEEIFSADSSTVRFSKPMYCTESVM
jgi:hypothetical protein